MSDQGGDMAEAASLMETVMSNSLLRKYPGIYERMVRIQRILDESKDVTPELKTQFRKREAKERKIHYRKMTMNDSEGEVAAWLQNNFLSPKSNVEVAKRRPMDVFLAAARKAIMRNRTIRAFARGRVFSTTDHNENPPQITSLLSKAESLVPLIDTWEFDIFEFNEAVDGNVMTALAFYCFDKSGLFSSLNIPKELLVDTFTAVQDGYLDVPYHNKLHGADVMLAGYYFAHECSPIMAVKELDLFSVLFAGAIHDFKHPGVNNAFMIQTNHEIALLYNDNAVLENYHIAQAFKLMQNPKYNLFKVFSKAQYREIRAKVVSMVLATDMAVHATLCEKAFKTLNNEDEEEDARSNRSTDTLQLYYNVLIHAADLSNPCRSEPVIQKWASCIIEEFHQQGDREASIGLEISPMMNRATTNVPKSQSGFLHYVVIPLMRVLTRICPKADVALQHAEKNKQFWDQKQ